MDEKPVRGGIGSVDRRIAAIAVKFGGHISSAQLHALGLSRHAIRHRVTRGLLIPVFQGIYAVGHLPTNPIDKAAGALLACGPRSVLSHNSAASLWGIRNDWRFPLHVTTPVDRRLRGLVIHRNRHLIRSDIRTLQGIRVLSPALTILQAAPGLTRKRLARAIDDLRLQRRSRLTLEQLERLVERFPSYPGTKALRGALGTLQREPTRSDWELDWPPFAAAHDLPAYQMNRRVCGHRVDVLFPAEGVVVELDGWDTHRTKQAFENDREQDSVILTRTGMPTIRITHDRFHHLGSEEAARLHVVLARRREQSRSGT